MTFKPKTMNDRLQEAKDILEAYVSVIEELRLRDGVIVGFNISNGNNGQPCTLQSVNAIKNIAFPEPAGQDNVAEEVK